MAREILSRTHPSPFDLGIGLAGGAAAAYALAQPRLSAALPGVAIATALMPPLCTVGIGISLGSGSVAFGAYCFSLPTWQPSRLPGSWYLLPWVSGPGKWKTPGIASPEVYSSRPA